MKAEVNENMVMQSIANQITALYKDEELNQQISGKIFDDCTPFKISVWDSLQDNAQRIKLMQYGCRNAQVFCRFLDALGDAEHTSDWDPYFKIRLRNGQIWDTDPGYWDFEIDNTDLVFDMDDDQVLRIPIVAIREIILNR